MMPTDMQNNKFAEDLGEEKSVSPTFRQLQLEAASALDTPTSAEKSSPSKQYMIVGFVLVNTRRERLVTSVNSSLSTLMPLMFILFFCLSGAHLELSQLPSLGIVGILYILGRSAGKISGARFGASFGKTDPNIKKYLGIAILSQAGVAIGLALILDHDLEKLAAQFDYDRAAFIGASVLNTVTATSIFFGIIAPILTKIAISRSGEMNKM